ncbi:ROK family protein, partial [Arthrobacter sp. JCM 19049]|uniref:ROK family protein n=1 Tax=Arthrobacter sp. JCM 19049 TaxID=1460643 RepID=UPI000B1B6691
GRLGHLETLASGRSVAARYYEMTGSPLTAQQVAQAARQGDGAAQQIFQEAGEGLAQAAWWFPGCWICPPS